MPDKSYGQDWMLAVDTADPVPLTEPQPGPQPGGTVDVPGRSMLVLRSATS